MPREMYDIWEDQGSGMFGWRLQLANYVASFPSEAHAIRYAAAVKRERTRLGIN